MTDTDLLSLLPPLTPDEEEQILRDPVETTTDEHPKELGVWSTIKPEDYWA